MDADVGRLRRERAAATADQYEAEGAGRPDPSDAGRDGGGPVERAADQEEGDRVVTGQGAPATESATPLPATTIARRR
ncbi:MAG: hypothetical protein JWP62_2528 [Blastococcus sp.]|nr:hypothetical protein [Blastococcus sp.]